MDDLQQYLQGQYSPASLDKDYSAAAPAAAPQVPCSAEKNSRIPCDVQTLTLIDATDGQSVFCNHKMTGEPVEGDPPERVRSDLETYDLVFERLADYENHATQPETYVNLQILPDLYGSCPLFEHSLVTLTGDGENQQWKLATPTVVKLLAKPEKHPKAAAWLAPFWFSSSQGTKELQVVSQSCGVRPTGEVRTQYSALVRIFPKDMYTLKFKLPPWKSWSGSKSGSIDLDQALTVKTSKSRQSEAFGETQSSSSTKTEKSTYSGTDLVITAVGERQGEDFHSLSESKGRKNFDTDYSSESESLSESSSVKGVGSSDTTATESSGSAKLKLETTVKLDLDVTLIKNEQTFHLTKILNNLLNIIKLVTDAIEEIKNFKPSVGWDISFEFALLEGSFTGNWGRRDTAEACGGNRYVAVDQFYSFNLDLKLFSFTFTVMAGFEFKVEGGFLKPTLQLTVKVEGSISCEVSLGGEYTSAEPDPKLSLDAVGKGKIGGYGNATLAGYQLVDMSAEVEGGLKFSGEFHISFEHAPTISGKVERLETDLTLTCRFNNGKERPAKTKLFDQKDLWSGYLPSC